MSPCGGHFDLQLIGDVMTVISISGCTDRHQTDIINIEVVPDSGSNALEDCAGVQ